MARLQKLSIDRLATPGRFDGGANEHDGNGHDGRHEQGVNCAEPAFGLLVPENLRRAACRGSTENGPEPRSCRRPLPEYRQDERDEYGRWRDQRRKYDEADNARKYERGHQ